LIVASPAGWSAVSKLKTGEDSNQSLLGPPGVAAERVLLSVPVRVCASMPADKLLVIDKKAILSAYGTLELALSEHASFRRRSIETRLWRRIGATIAHEERVVELSVPGAAPAKASPTKTPAK
jgi:HK97 family phage major capsid protein